MAEFRISNKAVEDLSAIWNYTLQFWSEKQADLYYEILINFCRKITENPKLGKRYDEIAEDLYGFKASKHIIFYWILPNEGIEVVRILHGSMDFKNKFQD